MKIGEQYLNDNGRTYTLLEFILTRDSWDQNQAMLYTEEDRYSPYVICHDLTIGHNGLISWYHGNYVGKDQEVAYKAWNEVLEQQKR